MAGPAGFAFIVSQVIGSFAPVPFIRATSVDRLEPARESLYRFGFSTELKTRFTKDWDILNVRAMAAGLIPAVNDARMRFALPSGISSISLIVLLRDAADGVPVAPAVAVLFLGVNRAGYFGG
jgi:hypothetical protein